MSRKELWAQFKVASIKLFVLIERDTADTTLKIRMMYLSFWLVVVHICRGGITWRGDLSALYKFQNKKFNAAAKLSYLVQFYLLGFNSKTTLSSWSFFAYVFVINQRDIFQTNMGLPFRIL